MTTLEEFELESQILTKQIQIQKQKNELKLLKEEEEGTFYHYMYGALKILDNPVLLLISIILFGLGVYMGGL